jgi:hypothetical protein
MVRIVRRIEEQMIEQQVVHLMEQHATELFQRARADERRIEQQHNRVPTHRYAYGAHDVRGVHVPCGDEMSVKGVGAQ